MLNITVTGNLVAKPEALSWNTTTDMVRIRLACNVPHYSAAEKQVIVTPVWCSGHIAKKKIENIMNYLDKGAFVVAHAPSAFPKAYLNQKGQAAIDLQLQSIHSLEVFKTAEQVEQARRDFQQQQQQQQPQQYQQPQQQPQQQQQQYQQPQQQFQAPSSPPNLAVPPTEVYNAEIPFG